MSRNQTGLRLGCALVYNKKKSLASTPCAPIATYNSSLFAAWIATRPQKFAGTSWYYIKIKGALRKTCNPPPYFFAHTFRHTSFHQPISVLISLSQVEKKNTPWRNKGRCRQLPLAESTLAKHSREVRQHDTNCPPPLPSPPTRPETPNPPHALRYKKVFIYVFLNTRCRTLTRSSLLPRPQFHGFGGCLENIV